MSDEIPEECPHCGKRWSQCEASRDIPDWAYVVAAGKPVVRRHADGDAYVYFARAAEQTSETLDNVFVTREEAAAAMQRKPEITDAMRAAAYDAYERASFEREFWQEYVDAALEAAFSARGEG